MNKWDDVSCDLAYQIGENTEAFMKIGRFEPEEDTEATATSSQSSETVR